MIERRTINPPRGETKPGNGTQPGTLEQRIASVLSGSELSVDDLRALVAETETAAEAAREAAIAEREAALDLANNDPTTAQQRVLAADLARDRLNAALPKLQPLLDAAWRREAAERWQRDYDAVAARLEDASEKFRAYPQLAQQIVELLTLAQQVDQEISRINQAAPNGEHRRLKSVELTARGLSNYSISQPPLARDLKLPSWQHSEKSLWPRSEPFVPLLQPGPFNPKFSDQWHLLGEAQRAAAAERELRELEQSERERREFYAPR
jgi:hypothetical protein